MADPSKRAESRATGSLHVARNADARRASRGPLGVACVRSGLVVLIAVLVALIAAGAATGASLPTDSSTEPETAREDEQRVAPRGRPVWMLAVLGGALAGISLGIEPSQTPRWSAQNDFDSSIRSGLVAGSSGGRRAASITSDVLLGALGAGLAVDWWLASADDQYDARRSITTDTSWILATLITTQSVKLAADRERPYVRPCTLNPGYSAACGDGDRANQSFFSGHASLSATFAGLLCARRLAIADRSRGDIAACGVAVGASLASGLLRVVADEHYATDVLVGWAVGAGFGYVMPRLWDYRGVGGPFSRVAVLPSAGIRQWGVTVLVSF